MGVVKRADTYGIHRFQHMKNKGAQQSHTPSQNSEAIDV